MKILFYSIESKDFEPSSIADPHLPAAYSAHLWRPGTQGRMPAGLTSRAYEVWWLFHRFGLFKNRDYCVQTIYHGDRLIHRSGVFPGYFRFPFMLPNDLQIGHTWTDPEYRGQGLATAAIQWILKQCHQPGRAFWYLVEPENTASIRAAEKAGLRRIGEGDRKKRFGLSVLGYFDLNHRGPAS